MRNRRVPGATGERASDASDPVVEAGTVPTLGGDRGLVGAKDLVDDAVNQPGRGRGEDQPKNRTGQIFHHWTETPWPNMWIDAEKG